MCLASGGSSGQRGVFVQTIGEYADQAASIMRNPIARQVAAGQSPDGMVIGLVAAAAPLHSTRLFAAAISGGPVRVVPVPATLPLAETVKRLNALQPTTLVGYPAKLAELAAEQRAGRLRIAPQSVVGTSEMLTAANRAAITAGFGVPVANSFSSTEGLVGHSESGETVLTFATDLCLAELVDGRGQPVPAGTPSAKVLITNLHNLTLPLIRYELTDSFSARPGTQPGGYLQAAVEGRSDGVFLYRSVSIHPHAIRTVLASCAKVTEYQVRQTEHGIDVTVIAGANGVPWRSAIRSCRHRDLGLDGRGRSAPPAGDREGAHRADQREARRDRERGPEAGVEARRRSQLAVGGEDRGRDRDPEGAAKALQRAVRSRCLAHILRRHRV
ncbi:MAG: hypothetical protein M3072_02465 [Candidatus Dormibacteraeota bacterium]|nr:hypothetical protein [Candidatus Dormibacteraeota bacterium]